MPMKDSWGGVQNVWFVSPALFPLFVGAMLALLGFSLTCTALKTVKISGMTEIARYLFSNKLWSFLVSDKNIRFFAVVINLAAFVFLMVPRVDFFPAAILFLLLLFLMFYVADALLLKKLLYFSVFHHLFLFILLVITSTQSDSGYEFYGDWFVIAGIVLACLFTKLLITDDVALQKKFRLSLIIAFLAPTIIGIIFKYFLLVPMPFEGVIVQLLDSIWYADFWS